MQWAFVLRPFKSDDKSSTLIYNKYKFTVCLKFLANIEIFTVLKTLTTF